MKIYDHEEIRGLPERGARIRLPPEGVWGLGNGELELRASLSDLSFCMFNYNNNNYW